MRKTIVLTDHGCTFRTGYSADDLRGATMDCKSCNRLVIFPWESTYRQCTRARDFHTYMHEQDSRWPADGAGCYSVGF